MTTRKPFAGLDPSPSDAELLRIRDERLARRPDLQHLREPELRNCAIRESGKSASIYVENCATPRVGNDSGNKVRPESQSATPVIAERDGDTLRLVLHVPPRTKKNGTTLGIRQKPAYRKFRDRVKELLAPIVPALRLPLPDQHYNIAAVYYVDRRGEPADRCGLDQGLYDALQDAGVIGNDWYFRTGDGTRVVLGDSTPRVEITISPLPSTP